MRRKTHKQEARDYEFDDEIILHLQLLYDKAWADAPTSERVALQRTANLKGKPSPTMVFSAIAKIPKQLDPVLATLLFDELDVKLNMRRMELDDVPLSKGVAHALQMAFAYELGRRIDRVLAEIGSGSHGPLTQDALEIQADAYCVPWQVVSYALSRSE